jgi:hypothetical protein
MANSSVSYAIERIAYVKLLSHCAKYPQAHVNGVLLGKRDGGHVVVSDAIPLMHHWVTLSPMMEIGLDLVHIVFHSTDLLRAYAF